MLQLPDESRKRPTYQLDRQFGSKIEHYSFEH